MNNSVIVDRTKMSSNQDGNESTPFTTTSISQPYGSKITIVGKFNIQSIG